MDIYIYMDIQVLSESARYQSTLGLYNVSNTQNMPAHREGAPAIEDTSHIADTTNEGWVHVDIATCVPWDQVLRAVLLTLAKYKPAIVFRKVCWFHKIAGEKHPHCPSLVATSPIPHSKCLSTQPRSC